MKRVDQQEKRYLCVNGIAKEKKVFDNKFKKEDPVAEAIKAIAEADYKAKMEELKGNQHKLDKNKNGKLDAQDFKMLRKEEEELEEGWDDMVKASKKNADDNKAKKVTRTGHEVKQTSTGKVYTKTYDKKTGLSEDEQLDELSTDTMKAAHKELKFRAYDAHMDDNKAAARDYAGRALHVADKIKKKERDMKKEEVDQLDELNKDTVSKYKDASKKQSDKIFTKAAMTGKASDDEMKTLDKRLDGQIRAKSRMEETELEERSLTPDEMLDREKIVKGMKKSLAGFKARYGDKAKSVMYATATKNAKKED
jgi:hypothetical protein